MTETKKHVIWSDIDLRFEDWKDELKEFYPDMNDEELYDQMISTNESYLDDDRFNLSKDLKFPIIAIADLGLWNGRCNAIGKVKGTKISDCLYTDCDYAEWYVDEEGDLRLTGVHHDGKNHYLYRVLNSFDEYDEIYDKFVDRIVNHQSVDDLIKKYTSPIGTYIAEIYGW